MVSKAKTNEGRSMQDYPEYVAALKKSADFHTRKQATEAALLAEELAAQHPEEPDSLESQAAALAAGRPVAIAAKPSLQQLRAEADVIRRAKEIADAELREVQLAVSQKVAEAWKADHSEMLHQLGDHLEQARAIMLEEAELTERLRREGFLPGVMPRPVPSDTPHLFQQLRFFSREKWEMQLKKMNY